MTRHLLDLDDLSPSELTWILDLADDPSRPPLLAGQTVGLYFEKPSLRTRHSCETAVVHLGGHPVTFRSDEIGGSGRESMTDITRVLSGYHAILGARVFDHRVLEEMTACSQIPIVNLLSDRAHPCQVLADLLTMRQEWGSLAGATVAWIGDFNNVARSLALGAAMAGMHFRIASPVGFGPSPADIDRLILAGAAGPPFMSDRPVEAAAGADAVHTDVWSSMGQEDEIAARRAAFEGFQVDAAVMAAATAKAVFMHCLPAHRGEEVATVVVDGPQSRVIVQAHNRLHAFRGLLRFLLEGDGLMVAKPQRQHRITKLLAEQAVTSQTHLVELLSAEGVSATQATVSRDLQDLGAIRVRVAGGDTVYAIPELPAEQRAPEDHLRRVFGDWVVEVNQSGNLVVLRTPPGSAHVVGSALDRSGLPGVLGTVAGDDTLIVVVAQDAQGSAVAHQLSDLAGL